MDGNVYIWSFQPLKLRTIPTINSRHTYLKCPSIKVVGKDYKNFRERSMQAIKLFVQKKCIMWFHYSIMKQLINILQSFHKPEILSKSFASSILLLFRKLNSNIFQGKTSCQTACTCWPDMTEWQHVNKLFRLIIYLILPSLGLHPPAYSSPLLPASA